jgi:hypothetical protein
MNSSRARDDATLIPNLGKQLWNIAHAPDAQLGAFFRLTKLEQDKGKN